MLYSLFLSSGMEAIAVVHGVLLSLGLIAAPGPQNIFLFQQGAAHQQLRYAAPSAIVASVADTVLIVAAVAGVSILLLQFVWLHAVLFAAGSVFLFYFGWLLLTSPALSFDPAVSEPLGARAQIGFATSVSLLNPHALLDTIAIIGANAAVYTGIDRWLFAAGCIAVSWLFFGGLLVAGHLFGMRADTDSWARRLRYGSTAIVWVVAGYLGWQFLTIGIDFI